METIPKHAVAAAGQPGPACVVRKGCSHDVQTFRRGSGGHRHRSRLGAVGLLLEVGAGRGAGQLLLLGFDPAHTTCVGGGENDGRTLTEANVVRSIVPAGTWQGEAVSLHAPPPAGKRTALLLQADDGRVLAAALLPSG